jgi:hypothetical protein
MMSRKDYVKTAEILHNFLEVYNSETRPDFVDTFEIELVEPFIAFFESDNPNFKAGKFWDSCFGE